MQNDLPRQSITLHEWEKQEIEVEADIIDELVEQHATREMISALAKAGKMTITPLRKTLLVETTSYVGRVVVGHMEITIQPKIEMMPLLSLLRYAYGLRNLQLFSDVALQSEKWTLQDLLIELLCVEISELLARGLYRRYEMRTEALASPRGRIQFQAMARQGGIQQAALPCTYASRLEDCLVNQVLRQGLRLAQELARHEPLRLELLHLERDYFSELQSLRLTQSTFQQVKRGMNRQLSAYAPSLRLIELLWDASGISFAADTSTYQTRGFLFDMNRFFQDVVERFLHDHLVNHYTVEKQYEFDILMVYRRNPHKKDAPRPRPDYVVKHHDKIVAILDAKYRDLWNKDLSPHMLYQLVIYALAQESCSCSTILYPTTETGVEEASIEVRLPGDSNGYATVILRPVHLLRLDELLRKANRDACAAFARQLVFGEENL